MTTTTDALRAALAACDAGISVVPPAQDGTKRPDVPSWKRHQQARATPDEIKAWYSPGRTGVGWVTGKISGNLEVIDFDDRSAFAEYERLVDESGLSDLLDRIKSGYFEHSPNGAHLAYRCDVIGGNTKLAASPKRKTLIETRGEGGYIIVAPSYGGVNTSGTYDLISGSPSQIVTITTDERRSLHDVARMLDHSPAVQEYRPLQSSSVGDRPGDDYAAQTSWAQILEPHGWVLVSSRLGVQSWRRPGKDRGISATTNHADSDLLYVFSTSTVFEPERGYSKFSAYAILNHGGDFVAAARELSLLGYGQPTPQLDPVLDDEVDISGIVNQGSDETQSLDELLRVPGLVGDLAQWMVDSAARPQPVLALGASIAAVATLIGRKVETPTGLAPNVYVLGVGATGCGKDRARQCIGDLFSLLTRDEMIQDSVASDAAIESAITWSPVSLFLLDEIGFLLGSMRGNQAPAYLAGIKPTLLKLYGASQGAYRRRAYADPERNKDNTIQRPCLSIYGTTVPENFYGSLSRDDMSNGLLSRFLVFESRDPYPELQLRDSGSRAVPDSVAKAAKIWIDYHPPAPSSTAQSGNMQQAPLTVSATPAATRLFSDLERRCAIRIGEAQARGESQGPYTRIWSTACKLSLIRACGVRPGDPEISESDARWGCDLAWVLVTGFVDRVMANIADSRAEDHLVRIRRLLEAEGRAVSKSWITRRTQDMSRRDRDDALATLIEIGDVESAEVPTSRRPKVMFALRGKFFI